MREARTRKKSHRNQQIILFNSRRHFQFRHLKTKEPVCSSHSSSSVRSPTLSNPIQDNPVQDFQESVHGVFVEDPPWLSSFLSNGNLEEDSDEKLGSKELERKKYNALRRRQVKIEIEAWEKRAEEYRELLREMCENKLAPNLPYVKSLFLGWFEPLAEAISNEQSLQESRRQKASYAPYIGLLPADKMAVIVMHKMMGLLMVRPDEACVRLVQAAIYVGDAIEQEVRIHSFLQRSKKSRGRKKFDDDEHKSLSKEGEIRRCHVEKLIKQKKLREVHKLVKNEEDTKSWGRDAQAKLGSCPIKLLIETAYVQSPVNQLADCQPEIRPAFRHTIKTMKEPGRGAKRCGFIECDPLVCKGLHSTARHMVIPYMPMLIPPKNWKGYGKGGHLFLPSYVMRTHGARQQQDAIRSVPSKQMQKVFEALDTLGRTKWRVNKRVLGVIETLWVNGGNIAGLVDREDVARKMKDEDGFYYPHNLDFRGRAYPMHSHLNHLSSDLCRGVLEFAEGRPLGKAGLRWLKIHLANLYAGGVEKLSYDMRLAFVENHLEDIFDSAERPIDGKRWWLNAEDPFQCLAACINLSEALKSSSPHTVASHLPIHQLEAAAVNLVAGERPADVYSEIAVRVLNILRRDCLKDPTSGPSAFLAKILIDQVDRKLVKQTVMTSVYGVTYIGAREQIQRRLKERGVISDDLLLFQASCYVASVTMTALGEMFQAARSIMGWLGDCAKVIASENQPVRWVTPLGLPVVQPYHKSERHLIRTSLQVLALQREGDSVDSKRQRTAFPPNFVHSLDGSHMMMTAVACRGACLHFAGVHDSFWTHACDVDKMNQILRKKFVELYDTPILENLLESFQTSFPTLKFPTLPGRGDFDLREVLESPYFFN